MSELNQAMHDGDNLVLRYLADPRPDLKDLIMVQYSNLVERIARRFSGLDSQEDLVQVGYIGLLNALGKYDPSAGVRFNTYATHLVAGEIKHYLRDRTQTIRQPAWLQELRHKVNKASGALQAQLGRQPSVDEIAGELSLSPQAIHEVYQTQELLKVASLDASVSEEDGTSEVDNLVSADYCPEQLTVEDRVVLERAMQQLRDVERDVIVLFHFESMNQTEIAQKLNISCNYVSHILRQSLGKLRRILNSEEISDLQLKRKASITDESSVVCSITSAYNEDYLRSRLSEELHRAQSESKPLALASFDFNGTEELKQYYGEICLRDFLADAGEFLKDQVRKMDVVCRFAETGFVVIMPGTGPTAEILYNRWQTSFQAWLTERRAPSGPIQLTGNVVEVDESLSTVEEVLDRVVTFDATVKLQLVSGNLDKPSRQSRAA